jgi:hypothetical protein
MVWELWYASSNTNFPPELCSLEGTAKNLKLMFGDCLDSRNSVNGHSDCSKPHGQL